MPVSPGGYKMGPDSIPTGRTAQSRFAEIGKDRPVPRSREMPFARFVGIKIFTTTAVVTSSQDAADDVIAQWDLWREDPENDHVTVQDLFFEFVTETKMALYVIYSE